ncbi:MAG: hypothetical protein U0359_14875 [Byssovorax sp.]
MGCGDEVPPAPSDENLLEIPAAGTGIHLATGDFRVDPGTEEQDCYFYRVRDLAAEAGMNPDEPVILHRTQIAYKKGSHHMNIFRVRSILDLDPKNGAIQKSVNGQSPCSKSVNWKDWPLIANSQNDGYFDWSYPDGVGNELMPEEWIMLQTHYVNATTQQTPEMGHVEVNLWTMPKSELVHPMGTVFATKQSIRVCQHNPTPRFNGTCQINSSEPVHVIGANGHFHSRGKEFDMYSWDGKTAETPPASERFYQSLAWNEPPMMRSPELDMTLPSDGGIWYSCSFVWTPPPSNIGCKGLDDLDKELFGTPDDQLDCCYTFGNTVDRAEHCNVFAYYYPKSDDVNCF